MSTSAPLKFLLPVVVYGGYGLYYTARCLLPTNYANVYSKDYPYSNYLSLPIQKQLANERWKQLSWAKKYEIVWHNTYMYIPDQVGNPYNIVHWTEGLGDLSAPVGVPSGFL